MTTMVSHRFHSPSYRDLIRRKTKFSTRKPTSPKGDRNYRHVELSILPIFKNSNSIWHKPVKISWVLACPPGMRLRIQVNMHLCSPPPFYTLPSEINLEKHTCLRRLEFSLRSWDVATGKSQDDVILWWRSICRSIQCNSLSVGVEVIFQDLPDICSNIQEMLLELHGRIKPLSVDLSVRYGTEEGPSGEESAELLCPLLYERGIVVEWPYGAVRHWYPILQQY